MNEPNNLEFAAFIISLIALTISLFVAVFVYRQLKETEKSRKLVALSSLFKDIKSPNAAMERATIYDTYCKNPELFTKTIEFLPENVAYASERVFFTFSEIGILVHKRLLDKIFVEEWLQIFPAKLWIILGNCVKNGARNRALDRWLLGFRYVAKLSLDYWFKLHKEGEGKLVIYLRSDPSQKQEKNWNELRKIRNELIDDLKRFGWIDEFEEMFAEVPGINFRS